jgi:hypothetical protein
MTEIDGLLVSGTIMAVGAGMAALLRGTRRAVIALWISQMGAGALLLGVGAELLAIACWISGTLVSAAYFLHADLIGEVPPGRGDGSPAQGRAIAAAIFPALISGCFGLLVWAVLTHAAGWNVDHGSDAVTAPPGERTILIELIALVSLAAVVAAGVISRPRRPTA